MVVVVVVEHYKAVVVFSLLRVVEWTGPPDPVICGKNWCKMRYYQPGGGAGSGVFSLQTNPTKNNVAVVLTEKNYKAVTAGGVFSQNALLSTFQQNQPNNQPKCACAPNNPTTN